MTTESIDQNNKAAYVCPLCRMVFSLPKNMGGNGVNCPGCNDLLTIPSLGDGLSRLGASGADYITASQKKVRNDASKHNPSSMEEGQDEWAGTSQDTGDKVMKIMLPVAFVSILLVVGLAYLLLGKDTNVPVDQVNLVVDPVITDDTGLVVKKPDETDTQVSYIYNSEDNEQTEQLEKFLTRMFAAKTVDELLACVVATEDIKEKMIKFYKGATITQSPFRKLKYATNTPEYPGYLTFESENKDYSIQVGILKYTKDKILLDWESFVAYSEMDWKELAEKKPTDSIRIRVTAKRAFYYNEDFVDENKWQAVSLISPNEEDLIYGYILKQSGLVESLFRFGHSDDIKVVLDVRFAKEAKTSNQVIIDRIVQQGWIIKEEK